MSERVNKFCDGLRDRLNAIEARVQSVKANIHALPGKAEKAVQEQVEEARAHLHAQKELVEKARDGDALQRLRALVALRRLREHYRPDELIPASPKNAERKR